MLISRYRQEFDGDYLNVPGLMLFGHNISSKAMLPMDNHIHEGCLEIVVVVKGKECYYVDNHSYDLSGGDIFISYLNQPHSSGNTAQGVCEIIWFQINPSVNKDFLGLSRPLGNLLKTKLLSIDSHVLKTDKEGISLLKKSFENFMNPKPENRLYGQSLLLSFLSKLLFLQNQDQRKDYLMKDIQQYIETNICSVIKIENICREFNISLSGFKHKFKDYMGVTPRDYINTLKVQKAKEMLKTGRNVTETAMQLSFNTSDYFSVVFKKYAGCSPSIYTLNNKKIP